MKNLSDKTLFILRKILLFITGFLLHTSICLSQVSDTATAHTEPPINRPALMAIEPVDFLAQVTAAIQSIGGTTAMVKISVIVLLLIASLKVSILNQLFWSKLGHAQPLIAPALGLLGGILDLWGHGQPVTLPLVFAYATAGGGAVFLHEILDACKALPGICPRYVGLIEKLELLLKAKGKK